VAYVPIMITGRLKDITTGLERLRLDWRRNDTWEYMVTDRRNALEGRQLLTLTSRGFPVAEHHAKEMAKYFALFEQENYVAIPQARITTHLGWQGRDGDLGFMFGRTTITPNGQLVSEMRIDETPPSDWREDWVSFCALTEGESELANGLQSKGDLTRWIAAITRLRPYPKALLAVYASLATPLLEIVKAPSFILDWSTPTSEGKTTTLRAGVSVWGYPREDAPNSLLHTWNNSLVWVERASGVLHGIPICLDDTSQAKPEEVNRVIYMFASGTGRGRGTPGGLAATRHWKTIMLSNGEQPIIAFTQHDGARMRVLCVRGMPFGAKTEATKDVVDHVNLALLAHYGHAGPLFVRWLLQHKPRWEEFRQRYQDERASLMRQVKDAAAFRLSEYAAVINVAGRLAHEALQLPWEYTAAVTPEIWRGIIDQVSGASAPERALRHVMSVAYSRETAFQGRATRDRQGEEIEPHAGWLGKWDQVDWDRIAFYPHALKKILREEGFPEEGILSAWKEKGWLHIEKGRRGYECNVWMGDGTARMIIITKGAIDEVCEEPDHGRLTDVKSTHDWDQEARQALL